ncbi:5'-nucleotidase C-terminal domain-containing protein [Trinickia sp. LjRoot230]|uniref:bifunctional metallophosphatase/5'-nucleotidase n=1 Tax=Trinickia sp. LjRoot230 TaxID=3342288 RepID=UPI003ECD386F
MKAVVVAIGDPEGHLRPSIADFPPPTGQPARLMGGAAQLATVVEELTHEEAHSLVISSGDNWGTKDPPSVSVLDSRPAIESLRALGLKLSALGNHDAAYGIAKLAAGVGLEGIEYLVSNVVTADGRRVFERYRVVDFGGIPVGFVGATTKALPRMVRASLLAGLTVLDEAQSINAAVEEMKARGVKTFVALLHDGSRLLNDVSHPVPGELEEPIASLIRSLDKDVVIVHTGHTHPPYLYLFDGRIVGSAGAHFSHTIAYRLAFDRVSHERVAVDAQMYPIYPEEHVANEVQTAIIERAEKDAEVILKEIVCEAAPVLKRHVNRDGQSRLGCFMADAILEEAMRLGQPADLAFFNRGGLRADLNADGDKPLRFGDLLAVMPVSNELVRMSLTGAQLKQALEQQWPHDEYESRSEKSLLRYVLQPSNGLRHRWDPRQPKGQRIEKGSLTLHGVPIEDDQVLNIVVSEFLAGGGDGFSVLKEGTGQASFSSDRDAARHYLCAKAQHDVDETRIQRSGSGVGGPDRPNVT